MTQFRWIQKNNLKER